MEKRFRLLAAWGNRTMGDRDSPRIGTRESKHTEIYFKKKFL